MNTTPYQNLPKVNLLFIGNHFSSSKKSNNVYKELPLQLNKLNWPTIITSKKEHKLLRLVDILWTIFRHRNEFDLAIIDVFSGLAFVWAECAAILLRILKKTYLLMLRGGNLPEYSRKHPKRVSRILKNAQSVYSPSPYLKIELNKFRSDIGIIPNPIDTQIYIYRKRVIAKPQIIWLRAFHEIYNPVLAVEVLGELSKTIDDMQLIMIGPDKGDGSFTQVIRTADKLGIQEKLVLPGQIPRGEVPRWLDQADIFINTTNYDNTPVSVIEAMAAGLCVVSTNVGGIPYLIENWKDGLLVPPNDPISMTNAIKQILEDQILSGSLSMNAREKAEKLDWSGILPQWENVLRNATQAHET